MVPFPFYQSLEGVGDLLIVSGLFVAFAQGVRRMEHILRLQGLVGDLREKRFFCVLFLGGDLLVDEGMFFV